MSASFISDIVTGRQDAQGFEILTVYYKVHGVCAVYRTSERVVVQFSDDDALGSEQRKALSPLTPLRGEINGLVDGWRESSNKTGRSKAKLFDRRVADALVVALQGDVSQARGLLEAIKADVLQERTSVARTDYIIAAAITTAVVVIIASVLASSFVSIEPDFKPLWAAAGFGAFGGLFSIALAIRARSMLTDLQSRDNVVDAILRIIVAAISAVVLICLLRSKIVTFQIGTTALINSDLFKSIVIAFVAGFSERLVGDLLGKAMVGLSGANPIAGTRESSQTKASSESATEQNPRGLPQGPVNTPPAPPPSATAPSDDADDGCSSGTPLPASDHTEDVELPEATGGIADK